VTPHSIRITKKPPVGSDLLLPTLPPSTLSQQFPQAPSKSLAAFFSLSKKQTLEQHDGCDDDDDDDDDDDAQQPASQVAKPAKPARKKLAMKSKKSLHNAYQSWESETWLASCQHKQ